MEKAIIVRALGESEVLLPGLITAALAANDRVKLRLALLQEAASIAHAPSRPVSALLQEAVGLEISPPELRDAHLLGEETLFLPGVGRLLAGLRTDLAAMLAPLATAQDGAADFAARVQALQPVFDSKPDQIELSRIAALTGISPEGGEKFHLLVMDLHKALNQLAASSAGETLDGAQVHGLTDDDRRAVRAFMRGLHRTAPLAFGHPGLGTTAVRGAGHLTIQNDIGTTDAHVLVVHVTDTEVSVTYTDIHRSRARFFIEMFTGRAVTWTPLDTGKAAELAEAAFYLVRGKFAYAEAGARDDFLEYLGSRLVFLIDWNKARKALQHFLGKNGAIGLLGWAAAQECGHRGFLELGGAELIYEVVQRIAAGRIRYGQRLDEALGEAECVEFLRRVLRGAAQGLAAGRSARLLRDQFQAELSRCLQSAENGVFVMLVRHLGLTRGLAEGIEAALAMPDAGFARRAKMMEAKADRLTADARELAARIQGAPMLRLLIDEVENTTDALEDCAYLLGVAAADGVALLPLAGLVTLAVTAMVQAVEAASRLQDGQRIDATTALQAIETVVDTERDADKAERDVLAALMQSRELDARVLLLRLELAKALEGATDCLSHAAFALRDRVMDELSA